MLDKQFSILRLLKRPRSRGLGYEYKTGDRHYRSFVGSPHKYDLVAAMVFNLLTSAGLRQFHRLLDIGCGSLRCGRLLIPYLNAGNYIGVEPNRWLVEDGIMNEIGWDQVKLKRPVFSYQDSLQEFPNSLKVDYAVAQSIFSHCGLDLIDSWLAQIAHHLKPTGTLFATFLAAHNDDRRKGWIYPHNVRYRIATISALAAKYQLKLNMIKWKHTGKQIWGLFSKGEFDVEQANRISRMYNFN